MDEQSTIAQLRAEFAPRRRNWLHVVGVGVLVVGTLLGIWMMSITATYTGGSIMNSRGGVDLNRLAGSLGSYGTYHPYSTQGVLVVLGSWVLTVVVLAKARVVSALEGTPR
jgi:hypothetical protein